jgi:hypothetical protein
MNQKFLSRHGIIKIQWMFFLSPYTSPNEVLATVKRDVGEQFDQQLKHLITEFADVAEGP